MQTPDALTRLWFKEVWNEGQEATIDRMVSPEARVHGLSGPGGPPLVGPGPFKTVFHTFREALADLEIEILRTVVDGDTCCAHCRVRGRHTGPSLGGPPTGRPVDFEGMTVVRIENGRMVEGWNCFDFLTMYQQIGWIPAPVAPVAQA